MQNRILSAQRDYTEAELLEAGNFFNSALLRQVVRCRAPHAVDRTGATARSISRLMQEGGRGRRRGDRRRRGGGDSGERKLLDVTDIASDMDRLRKMFSLFEKKTDLLQLLDVSSRAQGCRSTSAAIRSWCRWKKCRSSTAPYGVDGKASSARWGSSAPTRMAYERVIPIVDITARLLSNALSHNQ